MICNDKINAVKLNNGKGVSNKALSICAFEYFISNNTVFTTL